MRTFSKVPFNPATNGIVINVYERVRVRVKTTHVSFFEIDFQKNVLE